MSQEFKGKLSKRSSMWESTFTLPNYTRPQGWAVIDPGKAVQKTPEQLQQAILSILQDHFGGLSLEPVELEDCATFIGDMSAQGYSLSYNRLKRMIGLWLTTRHNMPQTEYSEGYRDLSFN